MITMVSYKITSVHGGTKDYSSKREMVKFACEKAFVLPNANISYVEIRSENIYYRVKYDKVKGKYNVANLSGSIPILGEANPRTGQIKWL